MSRRKKLLIHGAWVAAGLAVFFGCTTWSLTPEGAYRKAEKAAHHAPWEIVHCEQKDGEAVILSQGQGYYACVAMKRTAFLWKALDNGAQAFGRPIEEEMVSSYFTRYTAYSGDEEDWAHVKCAGVVQDEAAKQLILEYYQWQSDGEATLGTLQAEVMDGMFCVDVPTEGVEEVFPMWRVTAFDEQGNTLWQWEDETYNGEYAVWRAESLRKQAGMVPPGP